MADKHSVSENGNMIRLTGKGIGNKTSVKAPVLPKTNIAGVNIKGKSDNTSSKTIIEGKCSNFKLWKSEPVAKANYLYKTVIAIGQCAECGREIRLDRETSTWLHKIYTLRYANSNTDYEDVKWGVSQGNLVDYCPKVKGEKHLYKTSYTYGMSEICNSRWDDWNDPSPAEVESKRTPEERAEIVKFKEIKNEVDRLQAIYDRIYKELGSLSGKSDFEQAAKRMEYLKRCLTASQYTDKIDNSLLTKYSTYPDYIDYLNDQISLAELSMKDAILKNNDAQKKRASEHYKKTNETLRYVKEIRETGLTHPDVVAAKEIFEKTRKDVRKRTKLSEEYKEVKVELGMLKLKNEDLLAKYTPTEYDITKAKW